jgi:thiamine pyrophosphate-dependent acetolactate synthase large subunit-like protein
MRVADAIVQILKAEGVRFVAGFPGDDILPLFDALYQHRDIPLILTRHEQATVFMADGYARSSGEIGVALVTKGPGRCNAMTAIVNAFTDCVPLVVLFGHNARRLWGKGVLQEVPYLDTFAPVAKWAFSVPSPDRVAEAFRRAFTLARSGRPGPVILEIPQDISTAEIQTPQYTATRRVRFAPDPDDVDKALDLLLDAKRPVVYVGRGGLWSGVTPELVALAETYALPVMATLPAKGVMPEDHRFCLGLGGYPRAVYSTGQARKFAEEADLILALGCAFRQHATSGWLPKTVEDARLIQVDVDPAELHKNYAADLAILSDLKLFLRELLRQAKAKLHGWRQNMAGQVVEQIRNEKEKWLDSWMPRLTSQEIPMNPYRVCWDLGRILDRRNTIIFHDAGVTRAYLSHHYETLYPNGFIGFGGTSAMGWSIPAGMGAKLGQPDKNVVVVTGDGAFGMTGMEIETAARNGIRTLTIVLNNEALGASQETQRERFKREYAVHQGGDYAGMARVLGAFGERVEKPADLEGAVKRGLGHSGPAVLEVLVKPLEPRPWK